VSHRLAKASGKGGSDRVMAIVRSGASGTLLREHHTSRKNHSFWPGRGHSLGQPVVTQVTAE
jgi:hypothetical protein